MESATWIEEMPKKQPIKPDTLTIRQQIRLDPELYESVKELAEEEERSLAMMLRILVKLGLERVQEER